MKIYDVIGVGFGPSNITLAIHWQNTCPELGIKFLEKNHNSLWQQEMLIEGARIQHTPLRDLITVIDPRSKYTFINFMHANNKLHHFLDTRLYFPLRKDYADYINWCAKDFDSYVGYNEEVKDINFTKDNKLLEIKTSKQVYNTKSLVLALGREAYIPKEFENLNKKQCFHLMRYLSSIQDLDQNAKYDFSVIGSSQSAVEIILDLANKFPNSKINGIIKNFSFQLRETSPFSYEMYRQENIDFFYNLSFEDRECLSKELKKTNYSSVSGDILSELYIKLYMQSIYCKNQIQILNNAQIMKVREKSDHKFEILYNDKYTKTENKINSDFIILATGFRDSGVDNTTSIPILSNVIDKYKFNINKSLHINRNYSLEPVVKGLPDIYLSGLSEISHGIGDIGSFGLITVRGKMIMDTIMQKRALDYKNTNAHN